MAVSSEYQGKCFGKALLQAVEEAHFRNPREESAAVSNNDMDPIMLVAYTPEVLEAANKMYSSCGFHLHSEQIMVKMNIRLFITKI